MKGISKKYNRYFIALMLLLIFISLSSCGGISPSTQTKPVIHSFTADSTTIGEGDSATLSWVVTDATTINIDQGVGSVSAPSGSTNVSPTNTTTYTLIATNNTESSTATVTITIISDGLEYTIISTSGAGGQIEPAGAIAVSDGESLTFTITPVEDYQVFNVLVDDVSVGAVTSYTFTSIQQEHTIHAEFHPIFTWLPFVPVNMEDIWGILILLAKRVYNNDMGIGYDTIQEAIDAAQSGHTIIVSSDTYYENIEFDNKNITVRSFDPLDPAIVAATIIDGGGSGSVVKFVGGDTSTLAGFTIQNGGNWGTSGGGIFVGNYCAPTIINNTITDNKGVYGGGILAAYSAPKITGNIITNNTVTGWGGGIEVAGCSSTLIINGNIIKDNTAHIGGGGIYLRWVSSPIVTNNTITGNEAVGGHGGGIYVSWDCNLLPSADRPIGWGTGTEAKISIPPQYWSTVAGNAFSGNSHGGSPYVGVHVYFQPEP